MPTPGLTRSRPLLFTMRLSHNEKAQLAAIAAAHERDERAELRELVHQEYVALERQQGAAALAGLKKLEKKPRVPADRDVVKVALAELERLERRAKKKPDGKAVIETQRTIPLGAPSTDKPIRSKLKAPKKSAAERTLPLFGKNKRKADSRPRGRK